MMNIVQARSYVPGDAVAGVPLLKACGFFFLLLLLPGGDASPEEVLIQATVGHVLIDK